MTLPLRNVRKPIQGFRSPENRMKTISASEFYNDDKLTICL